MIGHDVTYTYGISGGSCASREQSQACLSYAEMEQRRRSQRRLKLTGINKQQDVCQRLRTPQNKLNEVSNADLMATYTVLNNPPLYPSAYMVLNNKGYTKHYYAGTDLCASREQSQACLSYAETKQSVRSNRVAARLGGGGLDALQHVIAIDDELQWKADKLFKQSLDHVNHRVFNENNLDCIMSNEFAKEEFGKRIDGIPYQVRADVKVDYWQFKEMVNSMLDDRNQGHEKDVYFYHSDLCGSRAQSQTCLSYAEMQQSVQSNHLGSASWITDYRGMAVQHIQYLPYGEPYINQRPFGYSERFTFTGKERDEETGYGYFGARYMDHELMTMWLSVDPMADKYPSISPYAYCAWNPVKLVDPDGRDIWEIDRKGNVKWKEQSDKTIIYAVNKQGKRTGASVDLSNDDILKQLKDYGVKCQRTDAQETPTKKGRLQAAVSTNKKDIVKFFKFTSENTDQEWGIYAFHKGKDSKYGIITYQYDDETPSKSDFKTIKVFEDVDNWSVSTMIHCHPNPRSTDEEVSSLYGDRGVAPTASYKSYYTYMSRSENLYKIDKKGGYTSQGRYHGYQSLMNIFK